MSPMEFLRLLVLGVCLLACAVNCEKSLKGVSLVGVHNDRDDKRLTELSVTAGKSGNNHPKGHPSDSKSQFRTMSIRPALLKPQSNNILGKVVKKGKAGSFIETNHAGSGRAVQFQRFSKSRGGLSPVRPDMAPRGPAPGRKDFVFSHSKIQRPKSTIKSGSPNSRVKMLSANRTTSKGYKPLVKLVKVASPGKGSAGAWSPRSFNSNMKAEGKGYTHVRHIKPVVDKTQAGSSAGGKFVATGRPSLKDQSFNHDLKKLGSSHFNQRLPNRSQGKFKPFHRLPSHTDHDNHTLAGTTPLPRFNSTRVNSTNAPTIFPDLTTSSQELTTESLSSEETPDTTPNTEKQLTTTHQMPTGTMHHSLSTVGAVPSTNGTKSDPYHVLLGNERSLN